MPYSENGSTAPTGAVELSPRRKPWVTGPSLTPIPSPARAGEGCRRRGEGPPSQGLRPGLQSSAPDGAGKRIPRRADFMNELTLHAAARIERGSVRQDLNFFFVPGEGAKSAIESDEPCPVPVRQAQKVGVRDLLAPEGHARYGRLK